jgi:hypothetical protein
MAAQLPRRAQQGRHHGNGHVRGFAFCKYARTRRLGEARRHATVPPMLGVERAEQRRVWSPGAPRSGDDVRTWCTRHLGSEARDRARVYDHKLGNAWIERAEPVVRAWLGCGASLINHDISKKYSDEAYERLSKYPSRDLRHTRRYLSLCETFFWPRLWCPW